MEEIIPVIEYLQKKASKIIYKDVSKLNPYINNARTHSSEQVSQISASIKKFGFTNPVLIDGEDNIIAGHGRVLAATKLKLDQVPCIVLDYLTEAEKKAYIIADNKLALNAGWDEKLLAIELDDLRDQDFDLSLIGFSDDELESIFENLESEEEVIEGDSDSVPDLAAEAKSKLGDIWILGNHRLMCGDSTQLSSVETLMLNQTADICFTSPPYNVGKTPNGDENKYINYDDKKNAAEYLDLLVNFSTNFLKYTDYIFCNVQSVSGNKVTLIDFLYQMKDLYADTIIWDKENAEPAMAKNVLNSQFEYIHVFSNKANRVIGKKEFRGTLSNIFSLNSRAGKEFAKIHKATFRVELPLFFIENFSLKSVIDPFGGTGTTLIACEKLKRKCFMMELDPLYIDVIVKRWQDFTKKEATLESSGTKFNDL